MLPITLSPATAAATKVNYRSPVGTVPADVAPLADARVEALLDSTVGTIDGNNVDVDIQATDVRVAVA